MNTTVYSTHKFEEHYLIQANNNKHQLILLDVRLTEETAVLAKGSKTVSLFTGDDASKNVLKKLKVIGVENIALRSAGFNHVDLAAVTELDIKVARVPAYSPYAIAEHTIALILALNRKLVRAHNRGQGYEFLAERTHRVRPERQNGRGIGHGKNWCGPGQNTIWFWL